MSVSLKVEEMSGYLSLIFDGSVVSSDIPLVLDQVIQAAERYKPSKMLIDFMSVEGTLSTMDRFNVGTQLALKYLKGRMTGKVPHVRFAFIGKSPLVDPKRFGETVATNRGINVKVFTEKAEALVWLVDESSENSKS